MVEMTEQQAIAKLKMNESRLAQINNQVQQVGRVIEEMRATTKTLEEMPADATSGLIPLGGVFVPITTSKGNIKVNIGSNVVVEKTREDAIKTLKNREENLIQTIKKLQDAGRKLSEEAMQLQQKLRERAQPNIPVISG